jgi:Cu/Ag efflux protein CusF
LTDVNAAAARTPTIPAWFRCIQKGILMKLLTSLTVSLVLGTLLPLAVAKDPSGTEITASTQPGTGTIKELVTATGVIESIDLPTRHVTIKNANGKLIPLAVGPEARNLEQLKVGDRVTVRYAQALTLTLVKNGDGIRSRVDSPVTGSRTVKGEVPGGSLGRQVDITANVFAVNRKTSVVTLRGTEYEVDLKVRDPAQLKMIKVGDQVHATYTEAVALSIK